MKAACHQNRREKPPEGKIPECKLSHDSLVFGERNLDLWKLKRKELYEKQTTNSE